MCARWVCADVVDDARVLLSLQPTPTHSLWLAPETLALAQEMAGLTTTTTTTVTHPDGTTVNVKTTAASAAKI